MENRRVKSHSSRLKNKTLCPACGAASSRSAECDVCGKLLSEGFQPLDAIRSSYGMQRKSLDFQADGRSAETLFGDARPLASSTAWACTVYSMVPYLGVLFVPLAIGFGGFGYLRDRRRSQGPRATLAPVGLSMVLLAVQILLWWLLYLIPEIGI